MPPQLVPEYKKLQEAETALRAARKSERERRATEKARDMAGRGRKEATTAATTTGARKRTAAAAAAPNPPPPQQQQQQMSELESLRAEVAKLQAEKTFEERREVLKRTQKHVNKEAARRGIRELPSESSVQTDDIGLEVNAALDYIEKQGVTDCSLTFTGKLYLNGKKVAEPSPPSRSTRYTFDLDAVEVAFEEAISERLGGFDDYKQFCTAHIKAMNGRGRMLSHGLSDYSIEAVEKIAQAVDSVSLAANTAEVLVFIEVKLTYVDKDLKAFRKAQETPREVNEEEDPQPKLKGRAGKIGEEKEARMAALARAGDAEAKISSFWRCKDKDCNNRNGVCWVDSHDYEHYAIDTVTQEAWANQCESGAATVHQPSDRLVVAMKSKLGATRRESRHPMKEKKKQSAIERMSELMEHQFEMQNRQLEAKLNQQLMNSMSSFTLPVVEYTAPPPPPPTAHAPAPTPPPAAPRAPPQPPLASLPPPRALSQPLPHGHVAYRSRSPPLREQSSSPAVAGIGETDVVVMFFNWEIEREINMDRRKQWETVKKIATKQWWNEADLKAMAIEGSSIYERAIRVGVPDGLARRFKKELALFKAYRKEQEAAMSLSVMGGGGGGGFIP